jgi:hypothetical protein
MIFTRLNAMIGGSFAGCFFADVSQHPELRGGGDTPPGWHDGRTTPPQDRNRDHAHPERPRPHGGHEWIAGDTVAMEPSEMTALKAITDNTPCIVVKTHATLSDQYLGNTQCLSN